MRKNRLVLWVLVLLLTALLLPSSALAFEQERFIGNWRITGGIERGLRTEIPEGVATDIVIEFKEDGTALLTSGGETRELTYAYEMGYTDLHLEDGSRYHMCWEDTNYRAFHIEKRGTFIGVIFERAADLPQPEATAEPWQTWRGFRYDILPDGTARILSGGVSGDVLEIPAQVNGVDVSTVGSGAYVQEFMSMVIFPLTLTTIEDNAFDGCEYLTELVFPSGVRHIGAYAAKDCPALKTVVLPEGLEELGAFAFTNCRNLTSVTIGEGLKTIPEGAFAGTGITKIAIPEGVDTIEQMAFAETPLEHVALPKTLKSVGRYVFMSRITVHGEANSAAQAFAKQSRYSFTTDPIE